MLVDRKFIEELIAPANVSKYTTEDPLIDINCALFKESSQLLERRLSTEYDFNVEGQASLWAKDILEDGVLLDTVLTDIIHRLYHGKYDVFTDRENSYHVQNAIGFQAVIIAQQMIKILPYLYPDLVLDAAFANTATTVRMYHDQYEMGVRYPLAMAAKDFGETLRAPAINTISYYPLIALLPKYVKSHDPIYSVQLEVDLNYLPTLTVGSAIVNFIRNQHCIMQAIVQGDKRWVDANKEMLKLHISAILNALTYVSADSLFHNALTRSVYTLVDYSDHLTASKKEHSEAYHKRWLEMVIPLGASWNQLVQVATKTC